MNIQTLVTKVAESFGTDHFLNGDCHYLAVAIQEMRAGQGQLAACVRRSLEEDGRVFCETYSHMVYESPLGECWDIDGVNADQRWEEQWPDAPDEDGFTNEFVWITMSAADVPVWLKNWGITFDPARVGKIKEALVTSAQIEFEEIDTGGGCRALYGALPPEADATGYILVTAEEGMSAPGDLETETFLIGLYPDPATQGEENGVFVTVAGRKGLNDWYEKHVGYRPDDDGPAAHEIRDLLSQTAEMMFYHLAKGEPKMNAPVDAAVAKEKVAPTYLTARFSDGQTKAGEPRKNVINLFYNGGNDTRGLPVFSNGEDKVLGLVNKTGAKLDLFHTDEHGDVIMDGETQSRPFLSVGLNRFTVDGTDAKALDVGQGAVTGPAAAALKESFKAIIAAKPEKKADAAPGV